MPAIPFKDQNEAVQKLIELWDKKQETEWTETRVFGVYKIKLSYRVPADAPAYFELVLAGEVACFWGNSEWCMSFFNFKAHRYSTLLAYRQELLKTTSNSFVMFTTNSEVLRVMNEILDAVEQGKQPLLE